MKQAALLFAFLFFFFGCIEQVAQQAQQILPSSPQQATTNITNVTQSFTCKDGTVTSDLSRCITCPADCSDKNPCTRDVCDEATKECSHFPIDGAAPNCAGDAGNCTQYSCVRGTCSTIPSDTCCGDGKRSPSETCSSCPQDVKCTSTQLCCPQGCLTPACKTDSDCGDNVLGTKDACEKPGTCDAKCINSQIRECTNGDYNCPFGCSSATDSDCKVQTTGTVTSINDDFIVSFSNPHLQSCKIAGRQFYDNYIIYDVTFENKKSASYPVFVSDFYARNGIYGIDAETLNRSYYVYKGEDYAKSGDLHPSLRNAFVAATPALAPPEDYEPPCSASERYSNLFQGGNIVKGSIMAGRVWIKIGSNGGYEKGDWSLGYTPKFTPDSPIETQIYIK